VCDRSADIFIGVGVSEGSVLPQSSEVNKSTGTKRFPRLTGPSAGFVADVPSDDRL